MKIFFKYVLFMRVHFVSVHVHTQTQTRMYILIHTGRGTSLLRSRTGPGKSHLNGDVTILEGLKCYYLHYGISFGTGQG